MYPDNFSLLNKTIIVTGASSGIGRECAIQCSSYGANTILIGRSEERLAETLSFLNPEVLSKYFVMDLTDYSQVENKFTEIPEEFLPISGLVNCAGISTTLPVKLITPQKINDFFNINVTASFNLARLVSKKGIISETGGSIIFLSSVMGVVGEVGKTIYSMTKGAIIAGTKSVALELAGKKIRVNCISPGVVETPMSKNAVYSKDEEKLNKIKSLHPLGLGNPIDVANLVVFLLSDASRWITGSNIIIDGGYTAR